MDKKETKSNSSLVDVKELAILMGLKPGWIRQNMSRLPHFKIGRHVRFDPEKVREAFEKKAKENQLD